MEDSQEKQAWITALRCLTATPKSRHELKRKLLDKGYRQEVVEKTLHELEERSILSDKGYAQNIVTKYTIVQPSGSRRIRFEMSRKGISKNIQNEIMGDLDPQEEKHRAREVALMKWDKLKSLESGKRKKRIYDFLIRRGFEYQVAKDLLSELEGNHTENECR